MKESLILVRLDTAYCNYLRKFDDKVPYNYNEKELRPYDKYIDGTLDYNIANRCCNFKLLEEKCRDYEEFGKYN